MHRGVRFMYENSIRNVFLPEQLRARPDGRGNSIVWLVWHLARTEDVLVNTMIRGVPQLLFESDWRERLGIDATHIGTGLGDEEVAEITKQINVEVADEYWNAVAKASYGWLKSTSPEELDVVPDLESRLRDAPPILAGPANEAVIRFWQSRTAGSLFGGVVVGHGYIHIGQMQEIGGRLGIVGWF